MLSSHSTITKKNGVCHSIQLYKCIACGCQFRGRKYLLTDEVWRTYYGENQTIREFSAYQMFITPIIMDLATE